MGPSVTGTFAVSVPRVDLPLCSPWTAHGSVDLAPALRSLDGTPSPPRSSKRASNADDRADPPDRDTFHRLAPPLPCDHVQMAIRWAAPRHRDVALDGGW